MRPWTSSTSRRAPRWGSSTFATYVACHTRLASRSRVLLYTDGVVESAADAAERGLATVKHVVHQLRERGCDAIADGVLAAIPHRLTDDAALLVLDYAGPHARREVAATHLSPDLRAVGDARRFLRDVLRSWKAEGDTVDNAELIASELVTNAVTHTGAPAQLLLTREPDTRLLRISVSDGSTRHPSPREADLDALGGRGLAIVDVLAQSWGVTDQGDGKAVWAELPLP